MGFLAWDLLILQPGSLSQTNLGPSASPLTARIALVRGYSAGIWFAPWPSKRRSEKYKAGTHIGG